MKVYFELRLFNNASKEFETFYFICRKSKAKQQANYKKGIYSIDLLYKIALKKAKSLGGKKYNNKKYGGGIVFQSYNITNLSQMILNAKNN